MLNLATIMTAEETIAFGLDVVRLYTIELANLANPDIHERVKAIVREGHASDEEAAALHAARVATNNLMVTRASQGRLVQP